jgi:hypothetical protein
LQHLFLKHCQPESAGHGLAKELTVGKVNDLLDQLAQPNVAGQEGEKQAERQANILR